MASRSGTSRRRRMARQTRPATTTSTMTAIPTTSQDTSTSTMRSGRRAHGRVGDRRMRSPARERLRHGPRRSPAEAGEDRVTLARRSRSRRGPPARRTERPSPPRLIAAPSSSCSRPHRIPLVVPLCPGRGGQPRWPAFSIWRRSRLRSESSSRSRAASSNLSSPAAGEHLLVEVGDEGLELGRALRRRCRS